MESQESTNDLELNLPDATLSEKQQYVELPSKGLFYYGQFRNKLKVLVRMLDWEDEDILTTKAYYDNGTLYNELLKSCIVDPDGFPSTILTNTDRDVILWWLRITLFGPEYTYKTTCPNEDCKHKHEVTWNLATIEAPEYKPEILASIEDGGMWITLPVSKLQVKIAPASIGREVEIAKNLKNKKTKTHASKDFLVTGKLLSILKEAKDEKGLSYSTSEELYMWLRGGWNGSPIPLVDSRYIRKRVEDLEIKPNTKKDIECPQCKHIDEDSEMKMTIHFFWPDFEEK